MWYDLKCVIDARKLSNVVKLKPAEWVKNFSNAIKNVICNLVVGLATSETLKAKKNNNS